MKHRPASYFRIGICSTLLILVLIAGIFGALAPVDTKGAAGDMDELQSIYQGIVGDPQTDTFGYLGDVGDYPAKLSDLISPSPRPAGWNGPYLVAARIKDGVLYDRLGQAVDRKIMDNPTLLNYQSLGEVSFNIKNIDERTNEFFPGCPGLYDIAISSVSRGANEAYMTYSPGGAVVDLLQGSYVVKVFIPGSHFAVWQEQLTVKPGIAL